MNDDRLIVGKEIGRLANIIRRELESYSTKCEYSGAQSKALHFLLTNGSRDIFQKDLEEAYGLRPASASQLLKKMEENGLILRKPLDSDARMKRIIPTEKALAYQDKMIYDLNKLEEKLVEGISPFEQEVFMRTIEKMLQNLS